MFSSRTFRGFNGVCRVQGVEIVPAVAQAGLGALKPVEPRTAIGDDGGMMEALMVAARLRRKSPGASLLKRGVINAGPFEGDVMASTLAGLLNAGKTEPQGSPVLKLETMTGIDAIGMCAETGPNYARLLRALGSGTMKGTCEVFVQDALPVVVRKSAGFGVPSAMTLETVRVNGFDMPPGSIVSLMARSDTSHNAGSSRADAGGVVVREIADIEAMAMMRIDAIALPNEDGQRGAYFPYERAEAREWTLDMAREVLTRTIAQV